VVQVNYVDASNGGPQAYESDQTPNNWGFISWTPTKSLLQGYSSNNLTLYMTNLVAGVDGAVVSRMGPNITLTTRPATKYIAPKLTEGQKKEVLFIALPTTLGFCILIILGLYFWNRKERRIGLGNVMGRKRGYGVGKSKRQRLRLGKKNAIVLQERDRELTSEGVYRDTPTSSGPGGGALHRRADSDALASLVETPTEESRRAFVEDMTSNRR
jgi:hypothetical protein